MQQQLHAPNSKTGTTNTKIRKPFARFIRAFVLPALVLLSLPAMAQPTVTALSTLTGNVGATVTITGSAFNATPANNIVYFGSTIATVSAGSTTSLTVAVPKGSTYMPVSVTDITTHLTGYSPQAFLQDFVTPACASATSVINFDPHFDCTVTAPPSSAGVKIGDIDGDGKPDVVVGAAGGSPGVYIYRNTTLAPGPFTAATFAAPVFVATTITAYYVSLGDIDGDGKLDIAVGAQTGNQVACIRNTSSIGSITTAGPQYFTSGGNLPYIAVLADLDNDGKPDMLVANNFSNNFSLFHNTSVVGAISFAGAVSFAAAGQIDDIQAADLDNDGKKDIVVVNTGAQTMMLFRNTTTVGAAFTAASLAPVVTYSSVQGLGVAPQCIILSDIDGDGKVDITIGTKTTPSRLQIFKNNAATASAFTTASFPLQPSSPTAMNIEGMCVGDFDGDGKPDIAVTNLADSSISVFRNTSLVGTPQFAPQIRFFTNTNTGNAAPVFIAAGDIDGDSLADLAVAFYQKGTLGMFRNDPLRCVVGHQVCLNDSVQFTEQALGGVWTSSNPGVGTADSVTGYVGGITAGTATICYVAPGGSVCAVVTVNPKPTSITGAPNGLEVCIGTTTTLNGTPAGGNWSLQNGNATIGSSTGYVTGIVAGTNDSACYFVGGIATCKLCAQLTINPTPAPITGTLSTCAGTCTQLTDASLPGVWTSSSGNVTISATGLACGITAGTATIVYSVSATTCAAVPVVVTVNPLPGAITGVMSMCQGLCSQLTDAGGGSWSSSAPGVATVTAGGLVCGVNTGSLATATATITYSLPSTGCFTVTTVTVNPNPAPITGTLSVCVGSCTALTDATGGGTWSSSSPAIGPISATGNACGVSGPGTTTITYALGAPTSCYQTAVLTVNPLPGNINGTLSVCQGLCTQLTDLTAGGTWSSSNPAVGTVGATGIVCGLITGSTVAATTTITYTLPTGCFVTAVVTVNPLPTVTTGPSPTAVCVSASITLCSTPAGGTWSSSSAGVASIVAGGGPGCTLVSGVAPGTANITYTLPGTGCYNPALAVVTVNPNPNPITGTLAVCVGLSTTLNATPAGGTWSLQNGNATGSASFVVTGVNGGTTDVVTYSITATGCYTVATVTINALPTAIGGTFSVCQGLCTTLTDGTAGGVWTSSNPAVVTITGAGLMCGVNTGSTLAATATITYTTGSGCYITQQVTVNPNPAPITGTLSVCVGYTTQLTDVTGGGTWSLSNGNATISAGGLVTGITAGTDVVTYTLPTGCFGTTSVITINPTPTVTTGAMAVCVGLTTTLSATPAGGTWTSSSPGIGSVNSVTGVVTGVSGYGTTSISYTLATGCAYSVTAVVTVNPNPTPILGNLAVCVGLTTQLSDVTAGGTWSSSAPGTASIGAGTGLVNGNVAGTATITYNLTATGCITIAVVTVQPLPLAISGTKTVCVGLTTSLSDASGGGVWTSTVPAVGTVGAASGIVTGISAGTTDITYTIGTGCVISATVTVNPLPGAINGTLAACQGLCTQLTDGTAGGSWSSSAPGIATVTAGGLVCGVVTGSAVAATATITYTLPTGCIITAVVTINPLPTPINGTLSVCQGLCTSLTDGTVGGSWSSSNPLVATVTAGGLVCGVLTGSAAAATATITYTLGTGCIVTAVVTVNPLPTAITGTLTVCVGLTTALGSTPPGGTWAITPTSIATISGTGVVTGVAAGTATVTYTVGGATGCFITAVVTVNPLPGPINGTLSVCYGLCTSLSDGTPGGTWSSSNPAIGSVSAGGVVCGTGAAGGTVTITYTLGTGCINTAVVTVNPLPGAITSTTTFAVCQGLTLSLGDPSPGGTWSTSSAAIASIIASGVLTGNTCANTATVTYTLPTTCIATAVVTVNCNPTAILGNLSVCFGTTSLLTDVTPGGSWSSSTPTVATISAGGSVTTNPGNPAGGTTTITYTLATGCIATAVVTVNPLPGPINGALGVCLGLTTQLTDGTPFGTWSSTLPGIASISGTGLVTGNAVGTSTISYVLPTGCSSTAVVTVNPLPTAILGTLTVCAGLTTTLSDLTPGGTWSSQNVSVGTVGSLTGIVTGMGILATSTTTITYTLPTGCITTAIVTVNPLPTPINGTLTVCQGQATQLTDAAPFGTWTSSLPGNASISPTGLVTGIIGSTTSTITYTLPTSCLITAIVTVNPLPANITGTLSVCVGLTTTLFDATTPGSWGSSNPFVATIGAGTGIATGIAAGTTTITWTLTSTGCFTTAILTVNPLPSNITGPTAVCAGLTISLTDPTAGGSWSSSNTFAATVGSATGIVTGGLGVTTATTATITYTSGTGCIATYVITVNPLPTPILGSTTVCVGSSTLLTDAAAGGIWTSSVPTNGSFSSAGTGNITGITSGTTIVTYTLPTTCLITRVETVNPLPQPILGVPQVCVGQTTQLSDLDLGGSWTSSNTAVGTVGVGTGTVYGVSTLGAPFAITIITYTLPTSCYITQNVTVNALPNPILGTLTTCSGSCTTLSDLTIGGVWTSSNITNATAGSSSGVICGGAAPTTATITYTYPATGCYVTAEVTINPLPGAINGNLLVCAGLNSQLTDATAGGVWSSSNPAVGTINSGTGLFTALTAGTTTITYVLGGTGCFITAVVTVNAVPVPITGPNQLCVGTTIALGDPTPGGVWSSTLPPANVGPTGIVFGNSAGTTTISYTLPTTGCAATLVVTVNPNPAPITGNTGLCLCATGTLADITPGGTWSSVSSGIVIIDPIGNLTASCTISGTSTISYLLSTGCVATTTVTVSPTPPPITGTFNICTGSCVSLTDLATGGTWSSSTPGVATVNPVGLTCGIVPGGAIITYTPPTGCIATVSVNVYPTPANITPNPVEICQGLTANVSDITAGGTWSSGDPAVATVNTSGLITGLTPGTAMISYTVPSFCYAFEIITVDPLPGTINGNLNICQGLCNTLTDATPLGTWSSSNPAVATVGGVSGIVCGVTLGTAIITYTLPTGCITTAIVTVYPVPAVINGATSVCIGATMSLTDASAGGTWSSSNPSVGSISTIGIVTGVAVGTTTITYTTAGGCIATKVVTVFPVPAAITGTLTVCQGLTTALTDATAGGTWSSSAPGIASVGSTTGIVTGVSGPDTAIITFTSAGGCFVTAIVTVNPLPGTINGTLVVCQGQTTTLTDATLGGTWTSSNPSVASIGSTTGVVTGGVVVVATTATITYTLATGCIATAIVTVNPLPGPINGTLAVCVGSTTNLSDATIAGIWASSNPGTGSISATGVVTGVSAGNTTITYTSGLGCFVTANVTVNPLPAPITGTLTVCVGNTTQLSDATPGVHWTVSNPNATITFITGLVTGITAGTDSVITTIPTTGCSVSAIVTVDPLPATITGTLSVCVGLTTTLSDASAGGTWSMSSGFATIGSASGVVTGIAPGTAVVTYTLPTGCIITGIVTVNPNPTAVNGSLVLCAGVSSLLADATPGGTWSSSDITVATIGSGSGIYTGVSGGTATITYTLPTGCITTVTITVNPLPGTITGLMTVCEGSTTQLSDVTPGGVWSSSIPPLASIGSATGLVSGISAGTVFITYRLPTGCLTTTVVTINPVPAPISGNLNVCFGLTTTLSDVTPGGTWSTVAGGNISVVGSTGVVTGIGVGTGTVTYMLTATGCISTAIVTVNPLPAVITGTLTVCPALTTQLSDATAGGLWSSGSPGNATVTSAGGLVTGVTGGTTALITYTLPTGCLTAAIVTIDPLPTAILGMPAVCIGTTTTLSDLTAGGTWSSSNNAIGTIGSATGVAGGIASGTTTITYTIPTGCYITTTLTVNVVPSAISGNLAVCVGLNTTLTDSPAGGTWSSSTSTVGTIGSATGIATGLGAGTTTITYSMASGCEATAVLTVNPNPTAILGDPNVCDSSSITLFDLTAGGTWSSSDTAVAKAGLGTGVITGVAPGVATITYTLPTGCIATVAVTVHAIPANITGPSQVCVGSTITVSDPSPGGTWSSSTPTIGSISSAGVITGIAAGTTTISYSPAVGCAKTLVVTVNPLPNQFHLFGGGTYCQGGLGVPIGLDGSNVGVSYLLEYDSASTGFVSATGYLAGTGDTLHFGLLTVHGVYTVIATGTTTGCSIGMLDSVNVTITPTINPTVTLSTGVGDSVCPGTSVTITPTVTGGGTSPSFLWFVNGTAVSTGSTYTFIPANGDVVKVVVTSNAPCVFPAKTADTLKLTVLPTGTPLVNVTVDPGDTVCQYSTATFTATPTFGGVTPRYIWLVNNTVAGTGNVFTYAPGNGDVVKCKMISDYLCRTTDTAYSNLVTMTVTPQILPHVDIVPIPGFGVIADSLMTLTTVVTNAGPDPTFQWELNGVPIAGATNSTYSSTTFHDGDSVTVLVTSSGVCHGITTFDWIYVTVVPAGVGTVQYVGVSDIRLIPNPNTGNFALKGTLSSANDEDLSIEVTDMLGQIVFRKKARPDHGKINEQIELSNSIANGMYILNVNNGSDNKSFHFVVER